MTTSIILKLFPAEFQQDDNVLPFFGNDRENKFFKLAAEFLTILQSDCKIVQFLLLLTHDKKKLDRND